MFLVVFGVGGRQRITVYRNLEGRHSPEKDTALPKRTSILFQESKEGTNISKRTKDLHLRNGPSQISDSHTTVYLFSKSSSPSLIVSSLEKSDTQSL